MIITLRNDLKEDRVLAIQECIKLNKKYLNIRFNFLKKRNDLAKDIETEFAKVNLSKQVHAILIPYE